MLLSTSTTVSRYPDRTKEWAEDALKVGGMHDKGVNVAHGEVGERHQVRRLAEGRAYHDGQCFLGR